MFAPILKRMLDIIVSLLGLMVLSPILVIIAIVILVKMGPPVFFCQWRPGFKGKPFLMHKFCTMLDLRDAQDNLLPDEQRLTAIGRFIRRTSLDELPTLFNVLKGEMSLVGPRPLLIQYLERYTSDQARRHEVKPGITGWVQVNGRNALSWEEKFKLDLWYVDHWTLWLDIKILWLTIVKGLRREGISADGYATMPEFMGSEKNESF